ncbi:uncharacterized protein LOC110265312 [Arachis ipaensis]|uniref:uncharacterized protein LOC110265312 n=1 Tax=Arachis ipaensis TaxID=130454 RepID=UPI000A2B56C0|nr:uncharacterized protein LOC110265312 [Arachis ipaensis]
MLTDLLLIQWVCLESLLSIPSQAFQSGLNLEENRASFSEGTLECIFSDLVESLENAGESSVLPMLRSLRMLIELVSNVRSNAVVSISNIITIRFYFSCYYDFYTVIFLLPSSSNCFSLLTQHHQRLLSLPPLLCFAASEPRTPSPVLSSPGR